MGGAPRSEQTEESRGPRPERPPEPPSAAESQVQGDVTEEPAIGGHNPSARARHRTYRGALSGRPAWEGLLRARSPAQEQAGSPAL